MADRWVLSRAGILNVYQYGDETLHFGGGRLLLRGVNGSGKSTAMNMLLPFLLEADTRRIDAAGEQSGVLRSWMLAGRDEQQPQGYLWIELSDGDRHLTCGCGIRANRSTDRVTTWWFVTARRPGIDLALVEGRQPLSADALRAELEPGAVFAHDQRATYRATVRDRLYGGAELDQHVRLLHVVRSPRVGDRIDVELPRYLEDALPQLSESALDDAAQPLEDLEEHRRNVEDLQRTAGALDALGDVYRAYARAELRRRAVAATELVRERDGAARAERRAVEAHAEARRRFDTATAARQELTEQVGRLHAEIRDLERRDAYQAGADLVDLRDLVRSLADQEQAAAGELGRRAEGTAAARHVLAVADDEAAEAAEQSRKALDELASSSARAALSARPPDAPAVEAVPAGEPGDEVPLRPSAPVGLDPLRARLGEVRAAAQRRSADVVEVRRALERVDRAEAALRRAEDRAAEAATAEATAVERLSGARHHLHEALAQRRDAVRDWLDRLAEHRADTGLTPSAPLGHDGHDEAAVDLGRLHLELLDRAQRTVDEHTSTRAALVARHAGEEREVGRLAEVLDELEARELPEPPRAPWQRPTGGPCLAELVDVGDDVGPAERAGLEAALEAAGLLGAEVRPDGSLVADDALLVRPGAPAARPLTELLTATVPDDHADAVDAGAVQRILATISVDPAALDDDGATVVSVDGRFRTGALHGRHAKAESEHLGISARRAALERQRARAAAELADARAALAATVAAVEEADARIAAGVALREAVPPTRTVDEAAARAEVAEQSLDQARRALAERSEELHAADAAHGEAAAAGQRTAADLQLPLGRAALDEVDATLGDVRAGADLAESALAVLAGAVRRWSDAADRWVRAAADEAATADHHRRARDEHRAKASTLATLEDAIGVEYDEIVAAIATSEADLATARTALEAASEAERDADRYAVATRERAATSTSAREEADRRCVAVLPRMRAALAVPGLLDAVAVDHHGDATAPEPPAATADDTAPRTTPTGLVGEARATSSDTATHTAPTGDHAAQPPATGDDPTTPGPAVALFPTVAETPDGVRELAAAVAALAGDDGPATTAESVRQSLRQRRDTLGAGWDAEDHQPDESLPLRIEVVGPLGRMPLADAADRVGRQLRHMTGLLTAKQDQALTNLLQGLVAREVAEKLHAAAELVTRMNRRLDTITTSHGIGVSLRWRRRDDLDPDLAGTIDLLATPPDLRTAEQDADLLGALSSRIATARRDDPELPYRELLASVLDYRAWHRMVVVVRRPGRSDEQLSRRTALSEGEKKMVSYLPLFAAVAASCDALAERAPDAPRFVLLDDAFAKVSEDNHAKLFGLLVELDLDFIATSERLWGTHDTVPELAITEVVRDAELGTIVLEHAHWDGRTGALR